MLTLSDEIKIRVDKLTAILGITLTYDLYINDELVYKGTLYYDRAKDIYLNDILQTYFNDYKWFNTIGHTKGGYTATVKIVLSSGNVINSDIIYNRTEIPTVTLKQIPSILPNNPSDEFLFGWLCPTTNTEISPFPTSSDFLEDYNHSTVGHTVVRWNDLNIKTLYRLTSDKTEKIAETDTHNSRFYLIWMNRDNDYMCRPFCKKNTLTESVSTNYIYTFNGQKNPFLKSSTYKWTLNSDWLTYDEHNVYESILISPIVYLYDNETGKKYRVNVTNGEWIEKNSKNNKRPFNMTVNVELATENKITY